jgi:hypothetical protein
VAREELAELAGAEKMTYRVVCLGTEEIAAEFGDGDEHHELALKMAHRLARDNPEQKWAVVSMMEVTMDERVSENGRTPLERIKAEHMQKREQIMSGEIDELDWSGDIIPEQVGLKQVWADDNGKLWVFVRHGDRMKLRRVLEA